MEFYLCASFLLMPLFGNIFASKPSDVCFLQADEGPCRGDVPRYFYNRLTQECEEFSYGGCGGNSNNFKSSIECRKTCWKIRKVPRICRFPKDEGPCRGLFPVHYFNMTSMQCEQFSYGGCGGNENRFEDLQSCLEYCKPEKAVPVICLDPLDKGRCSASMTRYYFNKATGMCEEFEYSGCGKSNNNFLTRQHCISACGKGVMKKSVSVKKLRKTKARVLKRVSQKGS